MAANAPNRETVRDALATLLSTALVTAGPVLEVTAYEKGQLEKIPVVHVISGGSLRVQHGMNKERYKSEFRLILKTYVLDADTAEDATYTEQDVEDTLDLIDKQIADVIADNRNTANWDYIKFDNNFSLIVPVSPVDNAGGDTYWMEQKVVTVRIMDNPA